MKEVYVIFSLTIEDVNTDDSDILVKGTSAIIDSVFRDKDEAIQKAKEVFSELMTTKLVGHRSEYDQYLMEDTDEFEDRVFFKSFNNSGNDNAGWLCIEINVTRKEVQ